LRAVLSLRIAGTDEPAAGAVVRAQEEFPGAASAKLPDLMVLWNNARPFDAVESAQVGRIENRDPATRSADGGLFAYGPLIAVGPTVHDVRDFDIAPTVLKPLGLEVPSHLDGRAISEMIASAARYETLPRGSSTSIGFRAIEDFCRPCLATLENSGPGRIVLPEPSPPLVKTEVANDTGPHRLIDPRFYLQRLWPIA